MSRSDKVCEQAGIIRGMRLAPWCADFYLLEMLTAQGDKAAKWRLAQLSDRLAPILEGYLDVALGGELRHAPYFVDRSYVRQPMRDYLDWTNDNQAERSDCWLEWLNRRRFDSDLDLLKQAAEVFAAEAWEEAEARLRSEGDKLNVGGKAWATAARFLVTYKQGRMSRQVFIDRCWTLQHNNGFIFDKLLNVAGLGEVLEIQAANRYDDLAKRYATAPVRALWMKRRRQKMREYDPTWYGIMWEGGDDDD